MHCGVPEDAFMNGYCRFRKTTPLATPSRTGQYTLRHKEVSSILFDPKVQVLALSPSFKQSHYIQPSSRYLWILQINSRLQDSRLIFPSIGPQLN